ncbi:MAG: hypothetical protein KGL39_02865 [Patescibacteria group bacterium]|nr:hypothetical protein [Patescibacteria group bacterium]
MIVLNPHNIEVEDWPWRFRVPSARPNVLPYLVDVKSGRCDCPAGRHKKPCKHKRWASEYFLGIWKMAVHGMTESEAGWRLLRDIETFIENQ